MKAVLGSGWKPAKATPGLSSLLLTSLPLWLLQREGQGAVAEYSQPGGREVRPAGKVQAAEIRSELLTVSVLPCSWFDLVPATADPQAPFPVSHQSMQFMHWSPKVFWYFPPPCLYPCFYTEPPFSSQASLNEPQLYHLFSLFFFPPRSTFCETGSMTTRKCECLWPFS